MHCRFPSSLARHLVLCALALSFPSLAFGFGKGISGYSGQSGSTCASCHGGGSAPTVTLAGPTTLAPGATGDFTVTIRGGAAVVAGTDVAATAGTLAAADATGRLSSAEFTHSNPKAFSGGAASFAFRWTAPSTAGTSTLFAAGLSANGSGTSGDGTGTATLAISVSAPPPVCTAGQTRSCYTGPTGTQGVGTCRAGAQTCSNNAWGACSGEVLPAGVDTCNDGLDNDCDGQIDEGCPVIVCTAGQTRSCYTGATGTQGVGACKAGAQTCSNNAWGACSGEVLPAAEACFDGADNDCDGQTDEGCAPLVCSAGQSRPCYTGAAGTQGVGICRPGSQTCASNAWGACAGEVLPAAESCGNGLDDDCDGQIDEGCAVPACTDGQTQSCYGGPAGTSGVGVCAAGVQTCASGAWGACAGEVQPAAETCGNGLDDDCDGRIDEGCVTVVCVPGAIRGCTLKKRTGVQRCTSEGAWSACRPAGRNRGTALPFDVLHSSSEQALEAQAEEDAPIDAAAAGCSSVPGAAAGPSALAMIALALLRRRR